MRTLTLSMLYIAIFALSASAFQQHHQQKRSTTSFSTSTNQSPFVMPTPGSASRHPLFSAQFSSADDTTTEAVSFPRMIRSRLRKATGFSFTLFRATLRGLTGISLTAVYAGALAATGLWIRQTMSTLLSVFPSGFRYFLQPFLVLYYTPLIILRSLASPTNRKRAAAKHQTILAAWKEAVVVAEKTEREGYWPVVVSEEGYFELAKPPSVELDGDANLAEAMAATVEQAMELKSERESSADDDEDKK